MKSDPDVAKALNEVLTNELTSISQYFLHARMYQSMGYSKLGKKTYDESFGRRSTRIRSLSVSCLSKRFQISKTCTS
jgi:hypothetical protein